MSVKLQPKYVSVMITCRVDEVELTYSKFLSLAWEMFTRFFHKANEYSR